MTDSLTEFSKTLRRNSTDAEAFLWKRLRARQVEGIKFRRQQPIENFIVDFLSFEKRMIIELDGGQHARDRHKDILYGILNNPLPFVEDPPLAWMGEGSPC